jgi:hypothetical protein
MSDFSIPLRDLATRLPIPEPARSRVLLEMATDMEDLLHVLLESGKERSEAIRAVEEQFDLSEEALKELVQIHSSPLQRSLEGLSSQAPSPWERGILILVGLFVAPGLVLHLVQPSILQDASPLAFGLLLVLAISLGLGGWRAVTLFRPGAGEGGAIPRKGIRALPGLALLLLGLGFSGSWVELYRAILAIRAGPEPAIVHLVGWLHMASATLVVALSGALLTGLVWFFLEVRAASLEERAATAMLKV